MTLCPGNLGFDSPIGKCTFGSMHLPVIILKTIKKGKSVMSTSVAVIYSTEWAFEIKILNS